MTKTSFVNYACTDPSAQRNVRGYICHGTNKLPGMLIFGGTFLHVRVVDAGIFGSVEKSTCAVWAGLIFSQLI